MKNIFSKNILSLAITLSLASFAAQAKGHGGGGSSSSGGGSSSHTPNYGGSSGGSYKYNEPTYTPSKPSYSAPRNDYSSSKSSRYDYGSSSKPNYTPSKPSYSTPNYGGSNSGSYKYNEPTYSSKPKKDYGSSTPSYTPSKPSYTTPNYGGNHSGSYKPTTPSYTTPSKPSYTTPNYGGNNSGSYKYNEPTYSKPKYNTGNTNGNYNNGGYNNNNNNNNGNYNRPGTNKNGTVLLKDLRPGEGRTRVDGTTDRVHKDGRGYTHTFVDNNGSVRKESIRFDNKTGREVKISDTERRQNGDVITKYKSGVSEVRTRDGLRYEQDRYGKKVYQESHSTWNNHNVIYRQYNNNYTTVYVQNNYYGSPSYFYRPTYFDYDYYNYSLSSWRQPVYYSWQWSYNPWYSEYYRPYPTYYSPAYWLTDYLLMSLIQSNYERMAADSEIRAQQEGYNQVRLSEQIKEEIRGQVEQSLRQQQQAVKTQSTMDPTQLLKQGRLMVVHSQLSVEDQSGGQCQLDEGDVIRLLTQPSSQEPVVQLSVVSAKGTSCPIGTTLSLSSTNLVEMESEFQSRIQQGMTEMKSGKVGSNQ